VPPGHLGRSTGHQGREVRLHALLASLLRALRTRVIAESPTDMSGPVSWTAQALAIGEVSLVRRRIAHFSQQVN
jgi:hypothetical protein